jgi:hypothetical protein
LEDSFPLKLGYFQDQTVNLPEGKYSRRLLAEPSSFYYPKLAHGK